MGNVVEWSNIGWRECGQDVLRSGITEVRNDIMDARDYDVVGGGDGKLEVLGKPGKGVGDALFLGLTDPVLVETI